MRLIPQNSPLGQAQNCTPSIYSEGNVSAITPTAAQVIDYAALGISGPASSIPGKALCDALQPLFPRKRTTGLSAGAGAPAGGCGQAGCPTLVSTSKTSRNTINAHLCVPLEPALYFRLYHKDAHVCRNDVAAPPMDRAKTARQPIFEFSRKAAASLSHVCCNSGHHIKSQFSLTYHEEWPEDGRQAKKHLANWLKALRRWCPNVRYIWVLEFQERKAPHFHVWLDIPINESLRHYLSCSWVRITEGTEKQMKFHNHFRNFIDWNMQDGQYAIKYAEKAEQKTVPPEYHNVGRFWGCSHNMIPVPDICTAEGISRITAHLPVPWEFASVAKIFHKIMRRYHEKVLNYDRQGNRRTQKNGKVQKWKKSPLIRFSSGDLVNGSFKIPGGKKIFYQILNYIVVNGPDRWSLQAAIKQRIPF